jgi:hypothetical protein
VTVRIVFLREGTSDSGIVSHIEAIAAEHRIEVTVTDPDLGRLPKPPGNAVKDKLQAVLRMGGVYDLIVVHRDADGDDPAARVSEIRAAMNAVASDVPCVPVVPVRMTEAWLLTSERELRRVAGNPNGKVRLDLPSLGTLEKVPDPKAVLKQVLALASELSGRKLNRFNNRFSQHRRQLLDRLDRHGPVTKLTSWVHFVEGVERGLRDVGDGRR